MMIDDALVDKLAHLSRLQFNGEEKQQIKQDLEKMIGFIDKLKELDTTGVEPLLHMTEAANVLREDVIEGSISTEEALKNAPRHNENYFLVPKMMPRQQR